VPAVHLRCHDVDSSLLEGVMARGDRRVAEAIELAWRRGARFDAWRDQHRPDLWWDALAECRIDVEAILHWPYALEDRLPWEHIGIRD
jgi:hypothetical protein